ncbi:MAG: mshA [Acidobacteria bacterium]|nr:mshA [Acidobacteriota bacterium]
MRIAQIAPPWEPVPPVGYGGTERVIHYLTEELVRLGHQVTLFASGDSQSSAELVPVRERSLRADGILLEEGPPFLIEEVERVRKRAADFDVIHGHVDYFAFPLGRSGSALPPIVHTMHGRLDLPGFEAVFREFADQPLVSISNDQRRPLPEQNWAETIYHGLPPDLYQFQEGPGEYLLFLGRMSPEKRPDWAIEIAQRAGLPLVIAAKIDEHDREFFEQVMRPLLARSRHVDYIGEVGDAEKNALIGKAIAQLMPIDWPEPFGLAAIEALACGTPVVTRPCGALPEIITDGVDGFIRKDIGELSDLVATRIGDLSRKRCRKTFEERFTVPIMASRYLEVYERLIQARTGARIVAPAEDNWLTVDSALAASIPKHVVKGNHAYAVFDPFGDIPEELRGEFGFYNRGTRYVSELELEINGEQPCLLSSGYRPDSQSVVADLGNEHLALPDGSVLQRNALHVRRELSVRDDVLHQDLRIRNFAEQPVPLVLSLNVGADFLDLFEVRGTVRERRGHRHDLVTSERGDEGNILYEGLDGVRRLLTLRFDVPPTERDGFRFHWRVELPPSGQWTLSAQFRGVASSEESNFRLLGTNAKRENWSQLAPRIETDHEPLNAAIRQAFVDLGQLMSTGVDGLFPTAGIPWYATLFGRDSIITALQLLPWRVDTAVSTFFTLAHYQADDAEDFTDREPGKILHEWREGEMANLREIPFIPYYGTVDATPLFIHLAHAIYAGTAKLDLLHRMWPHVLRACRWIEESGGIHGDGFIDYRCRSAIGLRNQGWKDSFDAISHEDGRLAEGAIALIEAQAYAVQALEEAAALARLVGESPSASRWERLSAELRRRTEEAFWMADEGTYALALDGERKLCRVVASNAAHALFAGLPDAERARAVADRILRPDLATAFGIRTLSSSARRYNPMSYHNGSIWPHDNWVIAEGLRRYGFLEEMSRVHGMLLNAVCTFPLRRVPELYCGFDKDEVSDPVAYPTACAPQAWASGSVPAMVTQMLGLRVDAARRTISLGPLVFPQEVQWIRVRGLRAGDSLYDFTARREGVDVHRGEGYEVIVQQRREATVGVA